MDFCTSSVGINTTESRAEISLSEMERQDFINLLQSKVTSKPLDKKRGPYTTMDTAKLNNLSPMDYLTHVFRQLMEGNKDYESLLSGKLALQSI